MSASSVCDYRDTGCGDFSELLDYARLARWPSVVDGLGALLVLKLLNYDAGGVACGSAGTDEGGGRCAGPVAVPDQVQSGLVGGLRFGWSVGAGVPVHGAEVERAEVS